MSIRANDFGNAEVKSETNLSHNDDSEEFFKLRRKNFGMYMQDTFLENLL